MALAAVTACAPAGTTLASPAASTAARSATATPRATVNVDDMMGAAPSTTVFVRTGDDVRAIRLLDHAVRFRLPVAADARLAVSPDASTLYVVERPGDGSLRLRSIDVASGNTTYESRQPDAAALAPGIAGRGAVAVDGTGRLLVARIGTGSAWADTFDATTLRPLGRIGDPRACADVVLAAARRVAFVCASHSLITVIDGASAPVTLGLNTDALAGAVILADGTIVATGIDGALYRIRAGAGQAESMSLLQAAGAAPRTVPAGGIATIDADRVALLRRGGTTTVTVIRVSLGAIEGSERTLGDDPRDGIAGLWPFVYFTSGVAVRHIDAQTGIVETMTTLDGPGGIAALAAR